RAPAPARARPLDGGLRPRTARQAGARVGGARLGRPPQARRPSGRRARGRPDPDALAEEPPRRERRGDGRAARGGRARRLAAAAATRRARVGATARSPSAVSPDERVRELGLEIPEIPPMPFRPLLRPVLV